MDESIRGHLAEYDRAVAIAHATYPGMSQDERAARLIAGEMLSKHAPSARTDPTCVTCDNTRWPCNLALGAIAYADPHNN